MPKLPQTSIEIGIRGQASGRRTEGSINCRNTATEVVRRFRALQHGESVGSRLIVAPSPQLVELLSLQPSDLCKFSTCSVARFPDAQTIRPHMSKQLLENPLGRPEPPRRVAVAL